MSVVITLEDIRAYAEVDYIINHMNIKYKEMIPEKMLMFFSEFKDPNLEINLDPYVPLQNQGLSRYCLEIIALLHLKYWCENEERKKELYDIMLRNQEKLDAQMKDRFSLDNIFENAKDDEEPAEDFSKPKAVQKYEQYAEANDDIEDFTDVEEEKSEEGEKLPVNNTEQIGLLAKIKNFFASLLGKKN